MSDVDSRPAPDGAPSLDEQYTHLIEDGTLFDDPSPMLTCTTCGARAKWRFRSSGITIKVTCTECDLDADAAPETRLPKSLRAALHHGQRAQHHALQRTMALRAWREGHDSDAEGRYEIHIGDEADPSEPEPVTDDEERLKRAMELLDELNAAGFLPAEFKPEWRAVAAGYPFQQPASENEP